MSDTTTAAPPAAAESLDSPELARILRERKRLIDDIRAFNPTAEPGFLSDFSTQSLRDYLDHLRHARHKHMRLPGWLQRRTAALAEARQNLGRRAA